ncbi:unnamed protein product [Gongylonema pulchrum]|uniref:Autophagy-related protein 17 n=1 Tax=Gongylonema pulchrum TaxID=637853 RepID=A0A183CXN8_9BILA|nr:unnamed protein product [Gongylonema pulchrum]
MSEILQKFSTMNSTISERFWLVTSAEDASSAHDRMQEMRSEVLSYTSKIQESIEEVDRLCTQGAELLTPDQFHSLKDHRNRLETMYNQLSDLTKFLLEFSNESSLLHSFINEKTRELTILKAESGDPQLLNKSRQLAKEIMDEVVAAEARLKSITALSARIQSEIDGYVVEMRMQYPNAQFPSIDAHELTATISRLQTDYEILLQNCHDLSAFLSQLKSLALAYSQNVESLNESITDLEQKISTAEARAPLATSFYQKLRQERNFPFFFFRLSELEALQHVSFEQASRTEAAARSAAELSSALIGTDAYERITHENQCQIDEFTRRFKLLIFAKLVSNLETFAQLCAIA